eukprot:6130290-Alexandrium_andersonii.AAC.1
MDEEIFDRDIDTTILKIGAPEFIPKADLLAALHPWLHDAGVEPDQVELQGPDQGKRYTLQFKGTAGIAANRVRKAKQILYSPSTGWR